MPRAGYHEQGARRAIAELFPYLRDRLPSRPICITTVAVMSTSRRRGAIIGRASFHASTPRTPHPAVAERYGMRGPVEPKLALAKADDRDLVL